MNNAELIVQLLERAGVPWVFGIPSGPVLPLIEALRKSPIDFVLTASETSAGFMATTVGHLTGAPGVCVATVGPGATNLTTGVGAAWLDRSPVLAITCNVPTSWLERRIQMRIDHHALFQPLTKATLPLREDNVRRTLTRAIEIATAEPPGPVHLDLPEDVALATPPGAGAAEGSGTGSLDTSIEPAATRGSPDVGRPEQVGANISQATAQAVARALAGSRRPLLVTGLTFARGGSASRLLQFVERQGMPFVTTLHAKGFLPESHPNWCGVIGRARRTDVQHFVDQADLILAVGYDPIEINYEEWVRDKPVIHISTEEASPAPSVRFLLDAAGDLDGAVDALAALPAAPNDWQPADFERHRRALDRALRPECDGLGPPEALDVLRELLPTDGILAYDVGAHTHQIATQWRTDAPWTCLATNGWSSMGYGMPAAYAAKLVHPDRPVIAVVGDGGFQMTVGELAMARRLNLAVPVVVLDDGWLGLMKVKQERRGYDLHGVALGESPPAPDHYFGVPCRSARDAAELRAAVEWGLSLGGPSVIQAFVDVEPYSQTVYD